MLGLHVALLFLPPLPLYWKGSLWSHVLAYSAVLLVCLEMPRWTPRLAGWWRSLSLRRRSLRVYGAAGSVLVIGAALRILFPDVFARFSREEGLWEPLTVLVFLGGAGTLLDRARRAEGPADTRHFGFLGGLYALSALEEVDYLGVFGAFIGRIDGVYVGSLHDLIRLSAKGSVGPVLAMVAAGLLLTGGILLWRSGYLQPRRLRSLIRGWPLAWLLSGAVLIGLALAGDAGIIGFAWRPPTSEELLEFAGTIFLGAVALEVISYGRAESGGGTTNRLCT